MISLSLAIVCRRSPCGERGLKSLPAAPVCRNCSRSPCGERGLKSSCFATSACDQPSLPVRGAWIEINGRIDLFLRQPSLPVRGAWIEIVAVCRLILHGQGRSPCGERGLKSAVQGDVSGRPGGRSPCGERGLKLCWLLHHRLLCWSLPVRGAWIEMRK